MAYSIESLMAEKSGIKLDIGCGANKQGPEWVGIDMRDLPGVDIVHDVEVFPWPLPDESVLVAICSHLVEHLNPHKGGFLRFMDELWRVMCRHGQVAITTPYAGSPGYWQDPTHCNPCNEGTFTYFDPEYPLWQIYLPKPWKIEHNVWHSNGNLEVVLRKRDEES